MEIEIKYTLTFTREEYDALMQLIGRTNVDTRRDYFELTERQSQLIKQMYYLMDASIDECEEE